MKKKFLIICSVLLLLMCLLIYNLFFDINNISEGKLMFSSDSPDKSFTVNIYLVESTLSSNAIRGELVNNKTSNQRNIYWQYRISNAQVEWIYNENVSINGVILNVKNGKFDFRVDSIKKK